MKFTTSALLALIPLVAAHMEITSPEARNADETMQDQFPCGGANTVSSTRTPFSPTEGTLNVRMEHTVTNVEILLAIGNDPGSAFNTILRRTFLATGLGELCIDSLSFPNITSPTNATIQVQSNGHNGGGLYACADITITPGAEGKKCGTSSFQIGAAEVSGHANGTAYGASGSESASPSVSSSVSPTAASATPGASSSAPASGAGVVSVGVWGLGAALAGVVAMGL